MPRYLIFRKSGVHRAACFALYRVLLRQKHKLQLNEQQQLLFCKPLQAVFKRNSKLQSPPQISAALQLGYETLEGLRNGVRQQRILNYILKLANPPKSNTRPEKLPSSPRTKTIRAPKAPKIHIAPYPGAARTLARPFKNLSGRRHIPVLVNANRVPILRLTKPQSPFLSRIIRDTVMKRERRILIANRLASEIPIAEDEDEWDQILYEHFGLIYKRPSEQPWDREVKLAFDDNHIVQIDAIQKRTDISAQMCAIVEQEKALAVEEKLRIRDEKHKRIKARRLARRGMTESEIQEKLYPPNEKTVTHGAPNTTDEVQKQGQGGIRQPDPDPEQNSRKRGNKFKTLEELKRLREFSLRPKTEEEIAKIKEARAKRKEEESEKKIQKAKRKQENAAFWAQRLNRGAEGSTINVGEYRGLNKKAVSLKPDFPRVVRRMDYGNVQRQSEVSPLSTDENGAQNLIILRPSLFRDNSKNPQ